MVYELHCLSWNTLSVSSFSKSLQAAGKIPGSWDTPTHLAQGEDRHTLAATLAGSQGAPDYP